MTQVTPIYSWPYPENTDPPNGPAQIQAAVTAIENTVNSNLSGKQPLDADLTALAALAATAGMLSRTGAGAFAVRTILDDTFTTSVSNGTGAGGNPTVAVVDTGVITAGFTANTGGSWAFNTQSYRVVAGSLCFLHIQATYTGATITGPANGNIANTVVATVIPAACRPNRDMRFMYAVGSASCGSAAVTAAGTMQIESLLPTATISSGDQVTLDCMYNLIS